VPKDFSCELKPAVQPDTRSIALTEERLSASETVWAVRYPIINRSRWQFGRVG
jgi:hypothetical protein